MGLVISFYGNAMADDIKIEAYLDKCIDESQEIQNVRFKITNCSGKAYWINTLFLMFHWEIKDKMGTVISPYSLIQPIYETDKLSRKEKNDFILVRPNSSEEVILQTKLFEGYKLDKNKTYTLHLGYNSALSKKKTIIDTYTKSIDMPPIEFRLCN